MKSRTITPCNLVLFSALLAGTTVVQAAQSSYPVVDTNQTLCFDDHKQLFSCPGSSRDYYGQDAQYAGYQPGYTRNDNGTVTDNVTRLIWAQTPDTNGDGSIDINDKMTLDQARDYVAELELGGYNDWRLPTIKELYSLILFDGQDPSGVSPGQDVVLIPFLDQRVFGFNSGDTSAGERLIESQFLSRTRYVSKTMGGIETLFGVNFIDGRIKGYGMRSPRGNEKKFYLLPVRGRSDYGINRFSVSAEGATVTDDATGLIWQQDDSRSGMNFSAALDYCESLTLAGRSDWRLPNAKELQSIVDYSRSPDTSDSAAISPLFSTTAITNEAGQTDYPYYWSSTTHQNLHGGRNAVYLAFGRSLGYMHNKWSDVHGAGSQRSDPKSGDASNYPTGFGPQGDAIRSQNQVRCVTDDFTELTVSPEVNQRPAMSFDYDASAPGISPMNSQGNSRMGRPDPFRDLDKNGDKRISLAEAKGPLLRDFSSIDRDNNGYLTEQELKGYRP